MMDEIFIVADIGGPCSDKFGFGGSICGDAYCSLPAGGKGAEKRVDQFGACDVLRAALSAIFGSAGYRAAIFPDRASFIRVARNRAPACVLVDTCGPGSSGIDILREMDAKTYPAPILVVSGQENVPSVVQAMRNGAFDYIERGLGPSAIAARVFDALDAWLPQGPPKDELSPSPPCPALLALTRREREVLSQIAAAASNKEAARNLGISPRTVEIHRGHIMRKLGAKNSIDLMRIVMSNGRRAWPGPLPSQSRG
jgi:two-component system, LuxR family, response regulator FixJ